MSESTRGKGAVERLHESDAVTADRAWDRACQDLGENATDWMWESDATHRITYVSDRIESIMGVPAEFFLGKRRDLFMSETVDPVSRESHLEDLAAHRPFEGFVYATETPGGTRYVRISGTPLFGPDGRFEGYRGLGSQVTAQVLAERRANVSYQQLVDVVEGLTIGIAQYDSEDKLVFWNSAYLRYYPELTELVEVGAPFEQIIRWLAEAGVMPEAAGRVDEWVHDSVAARQKGRLPFEVMLADGRWILVADHRTSGGGIMTVHSDISALKKRERELAETALYLESAVRIGELGTWDWDPATNILRNADRTIEMCGLDPEHAAVDNQYLMEMIHPDDRDQVLRLMQHTAETGEPYTNEYRLTRPSGETRFFHERAERIVDEVTGKPRLHGTIRDITARRQHEEELRQSERLFSLAFHISPGMTAISEVASGRHVAVNDKWVEIMGWPREEAVGKTAFEMGVWANVEVRARAVAILKKEGRLRDFEGQYRTRHGEVRDFLISAETVELNGVQHMFIGGHDITERKRAERELRESEARLSGILRIAPEAVIVVNQDQRITLFNDGAERIFGYSVEETIGKKVDMLIPPEWRGSHAEHVRRFAEAPEASRRMSERQEISGLTKDGQRFPAEASISKLVVGGEKVFTILLHDISARKQAERLMLLAKEEAELASRAKSDFLANMSHELRTPLNAILGFSEVILNQVLGPVSNARYVDYARDIHDSGEHLLEIIADILDLSKIDAGRETLEEERFVVAEAIESCRRLTHDRAEAAGLEIAVDIPVDFPALIADRRKFKQIAINLLSNAAKFTKAGGRISVGVSINQGSGEFELLVSDTGIGMAVEDIPRVLEPFTQIEGALTRERQGTGLGLPLVRKLAELHGGSIDIDSAPGKGTRVKVRLPADRIARD